MPWRDVIAAAWYQHRTVLLVTSAVVVAFSVTMLLVGRLAGQDLDPQLVQLTLLVVDLYALSVGAFQAAPMIAREYEQQTQLLAWSQDVSPTRWLTGKTLLLGPVAVVSALMLGASAQDLVESVPATRDFAFGVPYFDASPLLQVGHVVFAFSLGLTLSALTRRTVLAMSLTFLSFLTVRILIAFAARPTFQTPLQQVRPYGQADGDDLTGALSVDFGYLTSTGRPVDLPAECQTSGGDILSCLQRNGIVGTYLDYQPAQRLAAFHLIEAGTFLAVALALATITWSVLRHHTR